MQFDDPFVAEINKGRKFCDDCVYHNPVSEKGWKNVHRCLLSKYKTTHSPIFSCKNHAEHSQMAIQTLLPL